MYQMNGRFPLFACITWTCMGLLSGCDNGVTKFPRETTTGRVTCNGTPVAKAMVYFEPVRTGKSAEIGQGGFALTRDDGTFTISTYEENDGAVIGKHKVRVGNSESSGKCDCSLDSSKPLMEVEVIQGQKNNFDLVLPRKSSNTQFKPENFGDESPEKK